MKCCMPSCKNSRFKSKSQGITFHVFPTEPELRSLWLEAIGEKDTWDPKESVICSEHFLLEDLYESKSGMQKLRTGAVPLMVKACRVCLAMDCKLFSIKKHKLEQAYEDLTGASLSTEARLPHLLCAECKQRLINCKTFRTKSLKANSLMMELLEKHDRLTTQNLQSIDRANNQLASKLDTTIYIDHFDVFINGDLLIGEEKTEYDPLESDRDSNDEMMNDKILIFEMDDDYEYLEDDDSYSDLKIKKDTDEHEFEGNYDFEDDLSTYDESDANEIKTKIEIDNHYFIKNDYNSTNNELNTNKNAKVETEIAKDDHDYSENDENSTDDKSYTSDNSKAKTSKKSKVKTKTSKKSKVETKTKTNVVKVDRRKNPNDDFDESMFTLTRLSIEERIAEVEMRKESSNYKHAVHKCEECFKGFLDINAYNTHMLRHTTQCGEYRCGICKIHYKTDRLVKDHEYRVHGAHRYNCNLCPYNTSYRQLANLHAKFHNGKKYSCPHCGDTFLKRTTFQNHVRIKHPSDFVCQLCGYSFVSEKGVYLHKKMKHRFEDETIPEDGPSCDTCKIRFKNSEALNSHFSASTRHNTGKVHNTPKQIKGDEENRKCFNEARKRRRKTKGEPIPCELCDRKLKNWLSYHLHFESMHADKTRTKYPPKKDKKPHTCEECGKVFQSADLVKAHAVVHTGRRPFKCGTCNKSFATKQTLQIHENTHTKPAEKKTFECDECGKHFSSDSTRLRHKSIHRGVKPFKCETCGKCFTNDSQRRAHIQSMHKKLKQQKVTLKQGKVTLKQGKVTLKQEKV